MKFDLNALRLHRNTDDGLMVKRKITRVPVRRPAKDVFFRSHPDPGWRIPTMILEQKEEGATYLLTSDAYDLLPELQRAVTLVAAIDRRGNPFLIPVPLPGEDGRSNPWHESLQEVVHLSTQTWVRCVANMLAGSYDAHVAQGELPEPEWPEIDFEELIKIAFQNRLIKSQEHPLIQQLLGNI